MVEFSAHDLNEYIRNAQTPKGNRIVEYLMKGYEQFIKDKQMKNCTNSACNGYGKDSKCYCHSSYDINETESCVSCGSDTNIKKSTHIDLREGYIEGAGQLCTGCYLDYLKDLKS